MKGREAVRSARRRESEAATAADQLRRELAAERAARSADVHRLEAEVRRLHAEHRREAAAIAETQIEAAREQTQRSLEKQGLTLTALRRYFVLHERLAVNACRFVSMTHGIPPEQAFEWVVTWITGRDFAGYDGGTDVTGLLVDLGLPVDGWIGGYLADYVRAKDDLGVSIGFLNARRARRLREDGGHATVSLNHAEDQLAPFVEAGQVHPDYDPAWYGAWHLQDAAVVEADGGQVAARFPVMRISRHAKADRAAVLAEELAERERRAAP